MTTITPDALYKIGFVQHEEAEGETWEFRTDDDEQFIAVSFDEGYEVQVISVMSQYADETNFMEPGRMKLNIIGFYGIDSIEQLQVLKFLLWGESK